MVDYSINLEPDQALAGAIHRACVPNMNTINQTLCEAIQLRPTAISIETKTDRTGVADADVKLAVWMAAWRTRIMPLIRKREADARADAGPGEARCITQLGVTAIGDVWKLYLLVDRGPEAGLSRLEFLEFPKALGDTRTVLGIYQLVAVLRHLCEWADENLRRWLEAALL